MSLFLQDCICSIAQFISKEEVIARIEAHVIDFALHQETNDHEFEMIIRDRTNEYSTDVSTRLATKLKKRKVNATVSKRTYMQTWAVLAFIHKNLIMGKLSTQRDMYYCLISSFDNQNQVNEIIQDVVSLLEVPRQCLGLFATSKGFIGGCLQWNEGFGWVDSSNLDSGIPIPGLLPKNLRIESKARYIIIIEKDGVFKRMLDDKFHKLIPSILITGCGVPDLSTRMLAYWLEKSLKIPVLCLIDYNPYGVQIMNTYMYGSMHMGLEAFQYALPNIHWVGIHSKEILDLGLKTTKMKDVDSKKLDQLLVDWKRDSIREELLKMKDLGVKVEIQALNLLGFDYLSSKYLKSKILTKKFL